MPESPDAGPGAAAPSWAGGERVLLRGGTVHAHGSPFATAMLVDGALIAWVGDDDGARVHEDAADRVIELEGALVTPGFVDAHVHATATGMLLGGLDLTACGSLAEALARIESAARARRGGVLIGHGWDETTWPEGRPPTREELDRATWGSVVYITRIDVHSAVVSSALLAQVPAAREADGFDPAGWMRREAHLVVREEVLAGIGSGVRDGAQRAMRARCAELGIVAVHEMAGPVISGEDDLAGLLRLGREEPGPLVAGYWGQLAADGGLETAERLGAVGAAGDLFVDGAIGSRTACMRHAYDDEATHGASFLDDGAIADHLIRATRAGIQAGFHVIGDAAMDAVAAGLRAAAAACGPGAVREARHRLEHAELLDDAQVALMAELGVTASMQPVFDALWGGPGGMYEQRIGAERASGMNRIADLLRAGALVAFGSDAPVTELGPWAAMRAAVHHTNPGQRISARAAFAAHTRAGWRAIGSPGGGVLAPGAPAHYVTWDVADITVEAPDDRVQRWSTDARSGVPGLPSLDPGTELPRARSTVIAGRTVFEAA